jgi:hypothetical protein
MLMPHVLDATVALVAEGYQSLPGMDWFGAVEAAGDIGKDAAEGEAPRPVEKTEQQKVAENNATLMSIMGALGGSDFGGATG